MEYTKTVTIGESVYTLKMVDPDTALDLFGDLLSVLGPGAAGLLGGKGVSEADVSRSAMSEAVIQFSKNYSKKNTKEYVHRCFDFILLDGTKPLKSVYAAHFQGKLMQMFELLYEFNSFNFADFFVGAREKLAGLIALAKKSA